MDLPLTPELLDLPPPESAGRVVVAMSGGVDSSATAGLLARLGYDVVGITLQLYDYGQAASRVGACCAGQDIHDARRVADRLGIPHYVLDYESRFRDAVIDDFVESYMRGETPIPCIRCNQTVKFRDLRQMALDLGGTALATGHYARRVAAAAGGEGAGFAELHRAADGSRDQSYFLFATTAEQLAYLRFPLGGLPKTATRALAADLDLPVAAKPDSQDICFVPDGRYADVIERLRPGAGEPGEIVDLSGRVLGTHRGVIHYTIGQRRGLGIGGRDGVDTAPLYVVRLEPASRRVVVGPKAALLCRAVTLNETNWLHQNPTELVGGALTIRVRSTQEPQPVVLRAATHGWAEVEFVTPEAGVAPGQAGVLYDGDRVLGGGWIVSTEADRRALTTADEPNLAAPASAVTMPPRSVAGT